MIVDAKKATGFSFAEKLKEGLAREQDFLRIWGATLGLTASPTAEWGFDMYHSSGQKAELKTEARPFESTPNVFIERWSSIESQTPGGPWQSRVKGVSLLYYWFPLVAGETAGRVLLFDSLPLLILNVEKRGLVLKEVANKEENGRPAFRGGGYAVKRDSLRHLFTECSEHSLTEETLPQAVAQGSIEQSEIGDQA
jgi:hypothetical protein